MPIEMTPAEARVLGLLVTHLSLAEIGERLGSSRATVKAHVAHIYKKLGARTRSQAVDRAREAGLLGEPSAREADPARRRADG